MISALPTPQSRNPCASAWKPCKIGNGGLPCALALPWGGGGGGLCSGTSLHTATDRPAGPVPGPSSGMVKDNFLVRGTEAHFRRWWLVTLKIGRGSEKEAFTPGGVAWGQNSTIVIVSGS